MTDSLVKLQQLATLIRYYVLAATTMAGSGHPTSSLSATDLMTGLLFGGTFRYDLDRPDHPNNDRLIFSKGHASPLFYALWLAAGKVTEEEMFTYRQFGSPLEGHPTRAFRYAEAATGSLGQGLSIGVGMAMNAKYLDKLPYRTYVLLGDSEMSEGSQWEAIQIAAHYRLDNLVGIIDVNRLGQRGETMYGHDLHAYERRVASFDWETIIIDGHSMPEIVRAFEKARQSLGRPMMIIARTIKGKGAPAVEGQNGWHGKPLDMKDYQQALAQMGQVNCTVRGSIPLPEPLEPEIRPAREPEPPAYAAGQAVATRKAYGNALKRLYPAFPELVSLDAEVSNSTYAEIFGDAYPDRFFEMYIAEQNMLGTALGLSLRGKLPFVSTFAAFLSRAYDQIRMSQYSDANLKIAGSHAGVSIGEDGPSQMGLEDLAMFRAILGSAVLYPADAMATERLVEEAARHPGIVYLRTTRAATLLLYGPEERFPIGGSKVLRKSDNDMLTVAAAGITLFEALAAYEELKKEEIFIRVIDLYSVKPVDEETLREAASATRAILTVEDHYAEGGLGESVKSALATAAVPVHTLAVRKRPKSGKPQELLDYEEISRRAIAERARIILEVETV
ncbi:MAG: transketolase [Desulfobacteraceae bacterium]|nr:transketolase [Desulfobacteraceae bacterium]